MIRKIQGSEYLKRYDDMTAAERAEYESRVGDWLSVDGQALVKRCETFEARLQNVLQVSAGWNDSECQAFEDGAVLLSALVGQADTWLPDMLYVKSAKRAVRQMFELLWGVDAGQTETREIPEAAAAGKPKEDTAEGTGKATQAVGGKSADKDLTKDSVRMQAGEAKDETYGAASESYTVKAGGAATVSPDARPTTVTTVAPERPKHVDQYVHLLPEKTQEHAAQLQGLYRELDDTRRKMDLLMDDKTAKDDDRAAWAKKATATDNKIRKILDELDAGWEKLVKEGRVVVDDLGNARVVEVKSEGSESEKSDVATEEPQGLTSEQKAKRRELRKWLVDTRRGNGDKREEHVKKWQENFREFLAFEGDAAYEDEKVMAAAEHYGIDLKGVRSQESGEKDNEAKSSNQSNELDQSNPTDSEGKETTD